MDKRMTWLDHIMINIYWLGINVASGTITPVLLPYLVALFVPDELKNTYLATVRVAGLAVAMMIQPIAGVLSDRNNSRFGRRRPYIVGGTIANIIFLIIVGTSPNFVGSALDGVVEPLLGVNSAYVILLAGIVLLQISSNFAQGALQGLIPDLVPENQRGRSSGVKAVLELLPAFLIIFIGPLVDAGKIWLTIGIIAFSFFITMVLTVLFVHEDPYQNKSDEKVGEAVIRLVALTGIFVGVSQLAVRVVSASAKYFALQSLSIGLQVVLVGLVGLIGMAGSIFIGVYFGAWIGIGKQAHRQKSFIWWVINRLLFLAAVGSIQGFAQYFLSDSLNIPNAATMTTYLLAAVGVFVIPAALGGGYLADRIGRKRLVGLSGLIAGGGTLLLLFSTNITLVIISGCIIGAGAGIFMATSWALGTDLAPAEEAGRYLGISNLAGAGAGIVGAGIGGPMADFYNAINPGMGYLVIFAIYGALFVLATLSLTMVRIDDR